MAAVLTLAEKVEDYKDNLKIEAEKLVLNDFPKKILELEEILQSDQFNVKNLKTLHVDLNIPIPEAPYSNHELEEFPSKKRKFTYIDNDKCGTKVFALPSGSTAANRFISEMIDVVKPRVKDLVEDTNKLKMWIQFMIPRIEDGNNFGVSVQEDTLGEIRTVESEGASYFDQLSRYYMTRAKIVSKVAKYPYIEDYRRTVDELDEKEYIGLRLVLSEVRNHYATLHDVITKNMEKIKRPRTSNSEAMY
ncbi:proteasome activator complex subunit 3-like isoform X1 [Limulus polyphemus]|uniref:Proteasome activator complex subunit 3-like isoform X1 n=1 Tax=Limulus polyphemus TaxID=6850 RepID=A0ABM1BPT1_LIMPO|nr:proteasome activator complex subunit 3-like isoform X1 [Limulus polyphemus]